MRARDAGRVFDCPDLDGPARADDDPCLAEARHEETAAFEAAGCATFSGHVGVRAGGVRLPRGLHAA
ncbi:hypothetical protein [Streptomyces globisporus]|uniref:hypothetical protein n=1 Tax=Streptomyces globisporus TaxID=1908 RepID=UPI0004CABFB7|nr:hypothetical protein [Streptomyces globisporus]